MTRLTSTLCCSALFLGLLVIVSPLAHAQKKSGFEKYRVKAGDSLELLAAEYYGNRVHKIYIMVENGMDHERPLKLGERLRIPISQQITTAAGDTLAGLAESYLGDRLRAGYLAEFNGLPAGATLALGQELTLPLRVTYRAKGEENLRDIALGLFADAKKAKLLQSYNSLDSDRLSPGQKISVPVPKVKVQAAKRRPANADAVARAKKRRDMTARARESLPKAQAAWRSGNYQEAKAELTKLETEYLDTKLASKVSLLLAKVYIAFADRDSALAMFRKLHSRNPKFNLDPRLHSPKVREVWDAASSSAP